MPTGPVTIADVAAEAGVSTSTASRALNGVGRMRDETRQRVREVALRLGFRPNEAARTLLRGRTFTVGLLTTDSYGRFSGPVMRGIEDALGAQQVAIIVCDARSDPIRERYYVELLASRRVDGIIVTGRRVDARPPLILQGSHIPVIYAFTQTGRPEDLCLVPDDVQGGRLAIEHLLALGRRRLAHLTGPARFVAARERADGVRQAMSAAGLELAGGGVRHGPWALGWGYEEMLALLREEPDVDGVFCGADLIAHGAIEAIRETGRRVPSDVAVVGFDNWEVIAADARVSLTSVDMGLEHLGMLAGQSLLAMIEGEQRAGVVRTPCELVVRASSIATGNGGARRPKGGGT
jgi:LacI family transcriptional regulator